MSDKMSPEQDTQDPKDDSYASKVFQGSSIRVVSSFSQTTSMPRRVFKLLALIICLSGFFYQSWQFLSVVLQYPTSIDIDIRRPTGSIGRPGFSFCDNNGINRRLFCDKFPDYCEVPSEAFCKKFEYYCGENKTLVPKEEYYEIIHNMTREEIIELNVDPNEFVVVHWLKENITGPHLRMELGDFGIEPNYLCYTLNDRVNNSLDSPLVQYETLIKLPSEEFTFNVHLDDVFLPDTRAGILFSVHSPFEAVNPLLTGTFMKPGRDYVVFVSMEEKYLLQDPYSTNCVNYTEMWEKRGRIGHRSKNMCITECLVEVSISCFDCVLPLLYYPTTFRLCKSEDLTHENCPEDVVDRIQQCNLNCRDDCHQTKYTFTVQERFSSYLERKKLSDEDKKNKISVNVYLEGEEIIVWKHTPKYMYVEVFSNIGGFIGYWLGISLLDITDVFEGFYRIFRHSAKEKKLQREKHTHA